MATTFKIKNGDVVFNTSSGRPKTIGNEIDGTDSAKAKEKTGQDLQRCLSLAKVNNGTTADIISLVGTTPDIGASTASLLLNRQIRAMFSNILTQQALRPFARPRSERMALIASLRVLQDKGDPTKFRFTLGVKTQAGLLVATTGSVG